VPRRAAPHRANDQDDDDDDDDNDGGGGGGDNDGDGLLASKVESSADRAFHGISNFAGNERRYGKSSFSCSDTVSAQFLTPLSLRTDNMSRSFFTYKRRLHLSAVNGVCLLRWNLGKCQIIWFGRRKKVLLSRVGIIALSEGGGGDTFRELHQICLRIRKSPRILFISIKCNGNELKRKNLDYSFRLKRSSFCIMSDQDEYDLEKFFFTI